MAEVGLLLLQFTLFAQWSRHVRPENDDDEQQTPSSMSYVLCSAMSHETARPLSSCHALVTAGSTGLPF